MLGQVIQTHYQVSTSCFNPLGGKELISLGQRKTPKAIPIKTRSCGDCFVFVMNKIFPFLPNPEWMFIFYPGSNKSTRDLISWQRSIHWFSGIDRNWKYSGTYPRASTSRERAPNQVPPSVKLPRVVVTYGRFHCKKNKKKHTKKRT